MKLRWMIALLVAAGVTAFAAAPASAQTFTLTATLTGDAEGSRTSNGVQTGAFGSATVIVDMTARTVTYKVDVFNLPSGVTASHIHVGAKDAGAGPVVVPFDVTSNLSNDFGFSGVAKESTFILRPDQGIRSADDMFQAILGGNSYVNVHSTVNPGGEIRGQLILKQ